MKLIEFSYRGTDWELQSLEFGVASLIVGKNATGKSRTIKQLSNFFKIIKQTTNQLIIGEYFARFKKDDGDEFSYRFLINGGNIHNRPISEELSINGKLVLQRKAHKQAQLLNMLLDKLEPIDPPANKLVIHVSRDIKKYPFFEDIAVWAEQSYSFRFGSITTDFNNVLLERNVSKLDDITTLYSSLKESGRKNVLTKLGEIGFLVEHVGVKKGSRIDRLQIQEKGLKNILEERELSQGMLRSLYLVIFLQYLVDSVSTSTILIDDLCEGLDYERAMKLGKMVYEVCKVNNIQLIATSNDMFLMDVVDLKYWNMLQRKNEIVSAINSKNHPDLFAGFKYTGLSNFDFFASDYISQKIEND